LKSTITKLEKNNY